MLNLDLSDMILVDSWTSLVGRDKGRELREKLNQRIRPEHKIISLDFSNVSRIDGSFAADFLLPLIEQYKNKKTLIGINVKCGVLIEKDICKKMGFEDIGDILKKEKEEFLMIDDEGNLRLLGPSEDLYSYVLNLFMKNDKLTFDQICVETEMDCATIKECLDYLMSITYLSCRDSPVTGFSYYEAEYLQEIKPLIGRNLVTSIEEMYDEIIEERHIELPSGVHTDTLYHVSSILKHPRLTRKIGIFFGDLLGYRADFVLTLESSNNIVLANRIAQAIGVNTRSIFAKLDRTKLDHSRNLYLPKGFNINEGDFGIIIVDVVVTGLTVNLLTDLVRKNGGVVVGICSIFDLSGGRNNFPLYNYRSLISKESHLYDSDSCPLCQRKVPIYKPKIFPGD